MRNVEYLIALFLLCAVYAWIVYAMKYIRNLKLFNVLFGCAVYLPYVLHSIIVYRSVGFFDWNFQNTLPTANVSPFMFSLIPLLLILPQKAKKSVYLLISLLSVGMFCSTVLGCVQNAMIGYHFHPHFLLDYIAHFALSLFGVYLVRSGQVQLTLKKSAASSAIILGGATLMLTLNLIFDTAFFGLSLRGRHSIYNMVLTSQSYLSVLIYYGGLLGVLAIGFLFCKRLSRARFRIAPN